MGFWALLSMDLFLPTPHFCIAVCSIQVVMFVGKRALSMLVPGHALLSYDCDKCCADSVTESSSPDNRLLSKVNCVNKSYHCIKFIHEGAASLQFTDDIVHAGVPEEVIKRAAFILDTIGSSNYVERLCNENLSAQDQLNKVLKNKTCRVTVKSWRTRLTGCWNLMFSRVTSISSSTKHHLTNYKIDVSFQHDFSLSNVLPSPPDFPAHLHTM
ncbi:hypothetical protein NC653_027662 [Populus alba x Populus x berolinensis]|uniref:Uncharacterized protein n=1 Tax=Populus alba x Populus x berolinensis TaxID=444605 RepID=A0AAD6Q5F2_9ROSI|nr:hypothetical protein NC653_027662 [Populus alba x Populus x berolinensis]